jgi:hypothetical protein
MTYEYKFLIRHKHCGDKEISVLAGSAAEAWTYAVETAKQSLPIDAVEMVGQRRVKVTVEVLDAAT